MALWYLWEAEKGSLMAQVTEAQLFEMLGRLFAELRAVNAENAQLKAVVAQATQVKQPAEAADAPKPKTPKE